MDERWRRDQPKNLNAKPGDWENNSVGKAGGGGGWEAVHTGAGGGLE